MYSALNLPSTRFSQTTSAWPEGAHRRTYFGQDVLWHSYDNGGRHLEKTQLDVYRRQGDPEVDDILQLLELEGRPLGANDDLLAMAAEASQSLSSSSRIERALSKWYQTCAALPYWVDVEQLRRGQEVFLAYLPAMSFSLYYRSLVPGFSIPRLAEVLLTTGYLAPPASRERVHERLIDTGALLANCFGCDVDAILPTGDGWTACLQVRCLHAKVRRALLKRKGASRAWDVEKLGIPISHEDMAATLLAFSANTLLGTEMILGFPLSTRERHDFIALWRYLGWLLGVPVYDERAKNVSPKPLDPCGPGWIDDRPDSIEHSYSVFQSIIFHTLEPNEKSVLIAHHLLRQGRVNDADPKTQQELENWFYYRSLQCRRFVGDPLADALKLPLRPTLRGRLVKLFYSTCVLWFTTFYTIIALPYSPFRRYLIRFHKRRLQKFANNWKEQHPKRVMKHLRTSRSTCPFAMVAPPVN